MHMRQTNVTRRARRAAAVAVATALLAAAGCGGDDDTASASGSGDGGGNADEALGPSAPASGDPVKVGFISDGANPSTDMQIELDVADATVQYLNEHRSGIGGRPIELVTCSAEADPSRTVDCANQMVEEEVVGVTVGSLAAAENVWEPLHEAHVPVMFYASNGAELLQDEESTFVLSNPLSGVVRTPLSVAQEEGAEKVTIVVIDVPAALSVYDEIAPAAFDEAGIELEVVPVPPGTADMTPQMQDVVDGDPGVVQVVGNDTFCISAFQGLQTAGFEGQITTISQCLSDATREAVPADALEGMVVSATAPVGVDNPSTRLYEAVVETFGGDIDTSRITGWNVFITVAGFAAALEEISGDITAETVTAAIKAMPETDLPGAGGVTFQCNGEAFPSAPAVCTRGGLLTTLDENGEPAEYEVVGEEAE
jgi:branched-chain amino acid transport system substrate-binding protein